MARRRGESWDQGGVTSSLLDGDAFYVNFIIDFVTRLIYKVLGVESVPGEAPTLTALQRVDGAWLFAERLLFVDWLEQRALS
jgi:hypothetical protein